MARGEIWEGIYSVLRADTVLLALLGDVTPMNQRLYRSWPQLQNFLSTYEPQPAEGWLVFHEEEPTLITTHGNWETNHETLEPLFTVVATRFSLVDDVIDRLDQTWQWHVAQQRDVQYGERILLFTRRFDAKEQFESSLKMPQKSFHYRMEFVLATQPV